MKWMNGYLGLVSVAFIFLGPSFFRADAADGHEVRYVGGGSPVSFIQSFTQVGVGPASVGRHLFHKAGIQACLEDPELRKRLARILRSDLQDQLGEDNPLDTRTLQAVPKGAIKDECDKILVEVALKEPIKNDTDWEKAQGDTEGHKSTAQKGQQDAERHPPQEKDGQKTTAREGKEDAEQSPQEDVEEDDRKRAEGTLKQHKRGRTRRHTEQWAARKGHNEGRQQEDKEAHLQQKESRESQRGAGKDQKHRRKAEEEAQGEAERLKAAAEKKGQRDRRRRGQQGQGEQQHEWEGELPEHQQQQLRQEEQQQEQEGGNATLEARREVEEMLRHIEQSHICVSKADLSQSIQESTKAMLRGLPRWPMQQVNSSQPEVVLAFLIQASWKDQMPILKRTFQHLYSEKDIFLYTVDRERMHLGQVLEVLPNPLPKNVEVMESGHSDYYIWPRVEIVLDGLRSLVLHPRRWDFVLHVSESDYPLHSMAWIRRSLAMQRNTNFISVAPRCYRAWDSGLDWQNESWYWWTQTDALASCGSKTGAEQVKGVPFPLESLENFGFRFGKGPEWMVLTRELVKYALSPDLMHFRRLAAMHMASDEIFWQTLVLNIPGFAQRLSPHSWFIEWGHGKTDHSPDTLTEGNLHQILAKRQSSFFMRKVSVEDSSKLLELVDDLVKDPAADTAPGPVAAEPPGRDWLVRNPFCHRFTPLVTGDGSDEFHFRYPMSIPGTPSDHMWATKSRWQVVDAYVNFMRPA